MRKTERQIELIKCLDHLIRLGQTGTPKKLAERLEISTKSLFQIIEFMKQLNAPILFDIALQSYVYYKATDFIVAFYIHNFYEEKAQEVCSNRIKNFMKQIDFKYPSLQIV